MGSHRASASPMTVYRVATYSSRVVSYVTIFIYEKLIHHAYASGLRIPSHGTLTTATELMNECYQQGSWQQVSRCCT